MSDPAMVVTQITGAILGLAAVLTLGVKAFLAPRMQAFTDTLARIEKRLTDLNGSVADAVTWRHEHEIHHAKSQPDKPTTRKNRKKKK
jgi:hypothetical protein|tara:strand:+ start:393 stop:656 length:264 start_codon:yes stop_codon:yes gene_type:complete